MFELRAASRHVQAVRGTDPRRASAAFGRDHHGPAAPYSGLRRPPEIELSGPDVGSAGLRGARRLPSPVRGGGGADHVEAASASSARSARPPFVTASSAPSQGMNLRRHRGHLILNLAVVAPTSPALFATAISLVAAVSGRALQSASRPLDRLYRSAVYADASAAVRRILSRVNSTGARVSAVSPASGIDGDGGADFSGGGDSRRDRQRCLPFGQSYRIRFRSRREDETTGGVG